MSAALVKAAKQFDALVATLPSSEGVEEAQLKKIVEPQFGYIVLTTSTEILYHEEARRKNVGGKNERRVSARIDKKLW
ncbi:hypothetical protein SCA6_011235 [Theobroma cacao]